MRKRQSKYDMIANAAKRLLRGAPSKEVDCELFYEALFELHPEFWSGIRDDNRERHMRGVIAHYVGAGSYAIKRPNGAPVIDVMKSKQGQHRRYQLSE